MADSIGRNRRAQDYVGECREAHFRLVWQRLAEEGQVDQLDGAEYRRVWEQFRQLEDDGIVRWFIIDQANIPAHGRPAAEDVS